MPAPYPPPEEIRSAFSGDELAVVRRAYAQQMLATLGVDNPAIEAAYAASWSGHGGRVRRRPGRAGRDLPFHSAERARRP